MDRTEQLIKNFGARIRHLRETKEPKISQEAFAEAAQMDRAGYGRIERGLVDMRLSTMARIAEALDVPIAELFAELTPPRRAKASKRK